ncbi:hypothetical protein [Methylomonas sp. AM2-LC]|uniref:hypothetical protein n=1 Tax=Methylomonas sp. AM2-LC TaxID=3153301 RepID=UPI0032630806
MNFLDFIKNTQENNNLIQISEEDMNFIAYIRQNKRELGELIGSDAARTLFESTQSHIDRVMSIIKRAQPGIDYVRSQESLAAMEKKFSEMKQNSFFGTDKITKFVKKGKQDFACDGYHAYDISPVIIYNANDDVVMLKYPCYLWDEVNQCKYIPAAWPDEGSSGGLGAITYIDNGKGWKPMASFSKFRFIYTHELELSAAQITENIITEIERGETPLTGLGSRQK